jgi:uncharacterized protein YacL
LIMLILLIALWIVSSILTMPILVRAAQALNFVIEGMKTVTLVRVAFGYLVSLVYSGLLISYLVHIGHPVLIVFLVAPMVLGWILQWVDSHYEASSKASLGRLDSATKPRGLYK